jgi:choline dehydrogenase-like flavoprotein
VAARLAQTPKRPTVLLLEAGPDNSDESLRVDGQRWLSHQKSELNWGYKTVPQEHCQGREIDYLRGRGLGGSTAINFGLYTIGCKDDYDQWAKIVNDDTFRWDHMKSRFKDLETFHGEVAQENIKYAAPDASDHGSTGALRVGYATEWEKDLSPLLDTFEQAGFPLNQDHNSGNPLGMAVAVNSAHAGFRSTAADLLKICADNLTIITDATVQRVCIEGNRAVGVESYGRRCESHPHSIVWR